MTDITFFYTADISPDPITGKSVEELRPKLPVVLSVNHRIAKYAVDCLIDSGSDINLFPADWGINLGLKIENNKGINIGGIKDSVLAFPHSVKLNIQGQIINTEAYFSHEVNTPLLGRKGFLDKIEKLVFEEKNKKVTVTFTS